MWSVGPLLLVLAKLPLGLPQSVGHKEAPKVPLSSFTISRKLGALGLLTLERDADLGDFHDGCAWHLRRPLQKLYPSQNAYQNQRHENCCKRRRFKVPAPLQEKSSRPQSEQNPVSTPVQEVRMLCRLGTLWATCAFFE